MNNQARIWSKPNAAQLCKVLAALSNVRDMEKFLTDILTEKEITEISARLEAARLLRAGATYVQIVEQTGLSSRTVARISSWLRQGAQGYDLVLRSIASHHEHILPAVPR